MYLVNPKDTLYATAPRIKKEKEIRAHRSPLKIYLQYYTLLLEEYLRFFLRISSQTNTNNQVQDLFGDNGNSDS